MGSDMIKQVDLIVSPDTARMLKYLAIEGYPLEVCGVLHAHNIVHQYQNTFCGDKALGFDMEVDIHDNDIKAVWHSHPGGLISPSRDDIPCMQHLAEHGFVYPWIIVTPKEVTQWVFDAAHLLAS